MEVFRHIAKGQIVPLMFQQDAVAASQSDVQLSINNPNATDSSLIVGYALPWDGEVIGISAALDSAASAGSLTVGASIGGTEDADSTITITTETEKYLSIPRGKVPFSAGDLVGAEITSDGSWNGTSSDLVVLVWVVLYVEGI